MKDGANQPMSFFLTEGVSFLLSYSLDPCDDKPHLVMVPIKSHVDAYSIPPYLLQHLFMTINHCYWIGIM
jgi:hypothetical protein